jgi:hypothetical protein
VLVSARRGRLKPEFQAKFGWLIGNLYARPATTDWGEQSRGGSGVSDVIARLLKSASLRWVEDKSLDALAVAGEGYKNLSADDLVDRVRQHTPKRLIDEVVDVVADIASDRVATVLDARLKTFEHHIGKITRDPGGGTGSALPTQAAPTPATASARDQIVANAREHMCKKLTEKESQQLKTALKSEARLKQLLK